MASLHPSLSRGDLSSREASEHNMFIPPSTLRDRQNNMKIRMQRSSQDNIELQNLKMQSDFNDQDVKIEEENVSKNMLASQIENIIPIISQSPFETNDKNQQQKKLLLVWKYVAHFLSQLKLPRSMSRPDLLSQKELFLINDKSAMSYGSNFGVSNQVARSQYFYKKPILKSIDNQFETSRKHIIMDTIDNLLPKILPTGLIYLFWQGLIYILSLCAVMYHPFELAFLEREVEESDNQFLIQRVFLYLFIINMIIQINCCYFEYGLLVKNRSQIIQNYFQRDFLLDICLVGSLTMEQTYFRASLNFIRTILFLWRILFRGQFITTLFDKATTNDKIAAVRSLVVLLFQIIFCCHISGCYFYLLGTRSKQEEGISWLDTIDKINDTIFSRYVNSFYFIVITMSTIGYGDIYPESDREKMYMVFMSFFSSVLFGYTINTLGTIFVEMDKKASEDKEKIKVLSMYLEDNFVDDNLQLRAKKYIEFILKENLNLNQVPGSCLNSLSPYLKEEIMRDMGLRHFQKIPFFRNNFSLAFRKELGSKLQEMIVPPEDFVFRTNTKVQPKLFILTKGIAEMFIELGTKYDEENVKILHEIQENEYFGQLEFITGSRDPKVSVRSKRITKLFYLELSDFLEIIDEYPVDREKYYKLRNEILFQNRLNIIGIRCYACGSPEHIITKCPKVGYHSRQFGIVVQNVIKQQQKFKKRYQRSIQNKKTFRSLSNIQNLNERLSQFQMTNLDMLIEYENNFIDDEEEVGDEDDNVDNNNNNNNNNNNSDEQQDVNIEVNPLQDSQNIFYTEEETKENSNKKQKEHQQNQELTMLGMELNQSEPINAHSDNLDSIKEANEKQEDLNTKYQNYRQKAQKIQNNDTNGPQIQQANQDGEQVTFSRKTTLKNSNNNLSLESLSNYQLHLVQALNKIMELLKSNSQNNKISTSIIPPSSNSVNEESKKNVASELNNDTTNYANNEFQLDVLSQLDYFYPKWNLNYILQNLNKKVDLRWESASPIRSGSPFKKKLKQKASPTRASNLQGLANMRKSVIENSQLVGHVSLNQLSSKLIPLTMSKIEQN